MVGVVHSALTCATEITLNTSDQEIAVCNLGSINLLVKHVDRKRQTGQRKAGKKPSTLPCVCSITLSIYNYLHRVPQARHSNLLSPSGWA
ncbi:MAG: hypothetical protein ACFHHU_17585 [Porticoccaceae bacterium]